MTEKRPVIEVKEVSHYYEGSSEPALKDVCLTIHKGEFIALVGQNGAGKTTLAKMFNGLLHPTEGQVFVDGSDTVDVGIGDLARVVGYTYQNPDHQIFSNSVREEIAFGPRNLEMSPEEVEAAVEHAAELVGMEDELDSYPFLLGRGQRQKLAVASVIAMGPPLLVIDEPTTGLDLNGSLNIMNLLRRWNEEEERTIVIITHDMNIVAEYAQRAVVMAQGQILNDGPTRQVMTQAEVLKQAFLKPPQITRVAIRLSERLEFAEQILTVDEFYAELTRRSAERRRT